MARQAPFAVVRDSFCRGGLAMWVMAGDAAQLPFAGLVAAAFVHLLHLVHGLVFLIQLRLAHVNGQELIEGQTRPIIKRPPSAEDDGVFSLQMALLADLVAQMGFKAPRGVEGVV